MKILLVENDRLILKQFVRNFDLFQSAEPDLYAKLAPDLAMAKSMDEVEEILRENDEFSVAFVDLGIPQITDGPENPELGKSLMIDMLKRGAKVFALTGTSDPKKINEEIPTEIPIIRKPVDNYRKQVIQILLNYSSNLDSSNEDEEDVWD